MNHFEILGLLLIIFFLINKFLISKKIFIDPKNNSYHKSFLKNTGDTPYSGGIIILISCLFFLGFDFPYINLFLILLFSIGLLSDLEIIKSPSSRIILQIIIILTYLIVSKNLVPYTRIEFIDIFFENYYIKLFFTLFCILVLINGSNFIDGVNTLASTYYLIVFGFILYIKYNYYPEADILIEKIIILIFFIFLIFNFFGKSYLGDNGAYLLAFIAAIVSINFANQYITVSPYFIVCLLWYPAFENLFSIIRKKINKISFETPDKKHFHHFLFNFIGLKIRTNKEIANTISGNIIAIYNLIYFFIIKNYYFFTLGLILSCIINIFLYISVYFFLSKKN